MRTREPDSFSVVTRREGGLEVKSCCVRIVVHVTRREGGLEDNTMKHSTFRAVTRREGGLEV